MSIISVIRSALSVVGSAARGLSNGMATAAKAAPKSGSAAGRDPCEPTDAMKAEKEEASQPGCAFTISEDAPIKEEPFKPGPPPPAPPKPLPLPPKKLAPINRASAAKPPPVRPKPTAAAPSTAKPATALGRAAAKFDQRDRSAQQKSPQEGARSM